MKPHTLPTSIAGIAIIVLILAPWVNSSLERSQVGAFLSDPDALGVTGPFNEEEQPYFAPDLVSPELPRAAYLDDEAGTSLLIAGTNGRRDLGLYLSYFQERGPPRNLA